MSRLAAQAWAETVTARRPTGTSAGRRAIRRRQAASGAARARFEPRRAVAAHEALYERLLLLGPAGLPETIVTRLNGEILKAVHAPDVRSRLETAGMPVTGTSAEEFARMVRDDIETFRRIVQASGIKPE